MLSSAGELRSSQSSQYFAETPLSRRAWWLTFVALLCGIGLLCLSSWTIVSRNRRTIGFHDSRRFIIVAWGVGLLLISLIPLFRHGILWTLARLRSVTPMERRLTTGVIFFLALGYLLLTAHLQGRNLSMNIQDEMMYLVGTQLLAHGHLYLPAHPMADFFQELFIFNKPVYASMYFPGTALFYAPSIWLHIPNWLYSSLISAAAVALTYRVLAEVLDGASGVLGAMLLVACGPFRWTSVMVMSHPLALLFGLLMFWSFLHWRRTGRIGWIVCFGACAGWAAITRPIDAIAWCMPPLLCIIIDLWRGPGARMLKAMVVMGLCAAPFISLQLIFDKGVTGRWFETPVQAYHHRNYPALFAGPQAATQVEQTLPQFKHYNERFIVPGAQRFQQERLILRFPYAITHTLPASWLLLFVPLGIVGLRTRSQWALVGVMVVFVLGYMTFLFFAAHYLIVIIPTGLCLVLLGARQLERFAGRRLGRYVSPFVTLILAGTALGCLPEIVGARDEPRDSTPMKAFNAQMATMEKPAVVFFHSQPDNVNAWRHEQVYNIDAAWPDDARVVRAQDLGSRDIELVRYYAKRQPTRVFYRFEQESQHLIRLGTATELLEHPDRLKTADVPPASQPLAPEGKESPDDPE
jgi:4-amino-4-deoxy-L-arabinose transferase-like glycosyltransferase